MKQALTDFQTSQTGTPAELIAACRNGDQKAQLQVYKLYYKPVYNTCLMIINDPVEAEGLMHEAFITAFENISCYRAELNFQAWLISNIKTSGYDGKKN
ncbi:MAG: sigma factor [Bacteroidales bacterium]